MPTLKQQSQLSSNKPMGDHHFLSKRDHTLSNPTASAIAGTTQKSFFKLQPSEERQGSRGTDTGGGSSMKKLKPDSLYRSPGLTDNTLESKKAKKITAGSLAQQNGLYLPPATEHALKNASLFGTAKRSGNIDKPPSASEEPLTLANLPPQRQVEGVASQLQKFA